MGRRFGALESLVEMKLAHPRAAFWRGKRVLITGHTGFKGAWAAIWLKDMGAEVSGFALPPDGGPNLFTDAGLASHLESHFGDLRDNGAVAAALTRANPEIVLHLGAQALVRRSYRDPAATFATNVQGTVNVLEAARSLPGLRAVLVVTSDKVYENDGSGGPFPETARLGGHDPYSASKAAAEVVTASYRKAFFDELNVRVATARGGNVIGGGDFSEDRIVPDVLRAERAGAPVVLRYPQATRPWQHVMDCLSGYLTYVEALVEGRTPVTAMNFGPQEKTGVPVADLVSQLQTAIGSRHGWRLAEGPQPPEMPALGLNCDLALSALNWRSRLTAQACVALTAAWYQAHTQGRGALGITRDQIKAYAEAL